MREDFHDELAELGGVLAEMCRLAGRAMREATEALLTTDLPRAEDVLSADAEIDRLRADCTERSQALLALQAPVARDLRTVVAAVYCVEKAERMGDLAAHVADTTRFSHPGRIVPPELTEAFTELGQLTTGMADQVALLVADPVEGGYERMRDTDHRVDELHAGVLASITGKQWPHGPAAASTLALVARFYERFGDQAVSIAKRMDFAATGELPS